MLLAIILLLPSICLAFAGSTPPEVDLGYARYQGQFNETTGLNTFFGIRYAAPPTGSARWAAPRPPQSVSGLQLATTQPPQCLQASVGVALTSPFLPPKHSIEARAVVSSEDCLFLNVYVPGNLSSDRRLPVVVWIHGGGYVEGSAAMPGEDLVHDSDDQIIAVLIQYRLGLFGFLPGTEVKTHGVLNAGLLDQQFALRWVQDHISSFGGDAARVTIWGESAGAGSVLQHIIANGGNTSPLLFQRAMTSSTFLPSQYNYDDAIPEELFAATVLQAGCANSRETLACLRAADADILQVINTNISLAEFAGEFQWVPVVDGSFIRESPVAAITAKRINGNALLSVTNTFEGAIFVITQTTNGTLAHYVQNAFPNLNPSEVASIVTAYQRIDPPTVQAQAVAVQGEAIFICPTYYLLSAFGNQAHKGEFAIPPGLHGDDLPYYFTSTKGSSRLFNNTDFINSFSKSFMDVIVSGNVNSKISDSDKTPQWPSWSNGHIEMLFNVTEDFTNPVIHTIQTSPDLLQRCDLWKSLAGSTKQ